MSIKKSTLFHIIISFLIIGLILGVFAKGTFAADFGSDKKPNLLERLLTSFFKLIARLIYGGFDGQGMSIDTLVFNDGNGPFSGLSLFKKGALQNFLATFYNLFIYIAMAMFIPIAYWTGISFAKAGDSPQAKSVLKDKLLRVVLTMAFLYTMPQLLTIVIKISNSLVDVFKGIGSTFFKDNTATSMIESHMEYVKGEDNIIDGITSLMLIGINLWLVGFYVIRDLTICFLFMLFPIIAIWYPFTKGMVKNWWSNMLGNVFAQPIQAVILTMVLSLNSSLNGKSDAHSLANSIYMIVAFGSIIPMTGILKSFLGLETGIGAGSSRAGLGGIMGAIGLARMVGAGVKNNHNKVSEGIKELAGNDIAQTRENKNLGSIGSGASVVDELQKPLVSPNSYSTANISNVSNTSEGLKRSNRKAIRQIASGVGGAVGGATLAAIGGSIGSGVGAREAMTLGGIGYGVGSIGGSAALKGATITGSAINQSVAMKKDINALMLDEVIENESYTGDNKEPMTLSEAKSFLKDNPEKQVQYREMAENKYLGLSHNKLDGTEFQQQERQALLNKKRWENMGVGPISTYMAEKSYANATPVRKSAEELAKVDNALFYQDKDVSLAYIPDENGSVGELLSIGAGNPYVSEPVLNPINFSSQSSNKLPGDRALEIETASHNYASEYMKKAYPEMDNSSVEYKQLYGERQSHMKREMTMSYQNNLNDIRKDLNMPNMNIQTNSNKLNQLAIAEQARRIAEAEALAKKNAYTNDPLSKQLGQMRTMAVEN